MCLKIFVVVVVGLVASAQISLASTVPAFLWSPVFFSIELKKSLNYQIMSPKDLANSVLFQGGWSDLLCSRSKHEHLVDLAIVFVGREPIRVLLIHSFLKELKLHSSDVAGNKHVEPVNLLKDHLISRMEKKTKGETDLVVLCDGGSHSAKELDQPYPESEIMNEVLSSLEQSGAKYAALYVSDPFKSIHYPGYRELERFLAEGTAGNASANSTGCDEVCKIKSSLLEGVLVGIVLLLILISGLCCMMGIDTPIRFEAPQDN
ncbi:uncharacterized protein LOC111302807 isoform X4 [Durio zibethinus]|uniref:Uncharacterized protein LOC111302807 isoform X4 n=1 Tax=Durio zibethinus TaxID=66656 RepID=A0A6P5ZNI8_DURZI|nr:uncharacterized protein LOC111302807 isoform X4 [Durio zibethinus]